MPSTIDIVPVQYSAAGPIVSRWDVEQATILTLQTWLASYLGVVANQHPNLFAPLPPLLNETIYGGADAETWQPSLNPGVIVNAEPYGDSIRFGSGDQAQWYELNVHVLAQAGDEDHARQLVDMYGAAVMGVIAEHGDLCEFAQNTMLVTAPMVEFIDPDERRFIQSVCTFRTLISPVVISNAGPVTTMSGFGPASLIASANVTVTETSCDRDACASGRLPVRFRHGDLSRARPGRTLDLL